MEDITEDLQKALQIIMSDTYLQKLIQAKLSPEPAKELIRVQNQITYRVRKGSMYPEEHAYYCHFIKRLTPRMARWIKEELENAHPQKSNRIQTIRTDCVGSNRCNTDGSTG